MTKAGSYSPNALAFEHELDDTSLQELYSWIDSIPLSRPKKNISRDFSDGVLAAEVVSHFIPRLVELHNYSPASSTTQKLTNWQTLNRKVLVKVGLKLPDGTLRQIVSCQPGSVEIALHNIKLRLEATLARTRHESHGIGNSYMNHAGERYYDNERISGMRPPYSFAGSDGVIDNYTEIEKRIFAAEKDQNFYEQQETMHLLQMKIRRLEHLVRIRDLRIEHLSTQLSESNRKLQEYDHEKNVAQIHQ
ncbi:hypothetical protein LOD99_1348 [Oopsacas minuta]|uniref:Calponin-homology (CH) domain-containing protein n=1 Tax=Oopsacas minuta TaxID=111878 RepID=A0AAV7K652_9METZ|nr:hypothetical protein LOD99_1348 [Oopsacas minuta]